MSNMKYHLAQVNVARMLAPLDDPIMAGFVARLDEINGLADSAPGFVWRLQTEAGDATALRVFDDNYLLINMSVWESAEALFDYVYRGPHAEVYRRRRDWFEKIDAPTLAMWWIPAGRLPTTEEAKDKFEHLRECGPTLVAFTFKGRFTVEEMFKTISSV